MTNIGFVLFQKGDEPGTLNAKWCHSYSRQGTGNATGAPSEGFTGKYHIRYYDAEGNVDADRELDIQKKGEIYDLTWIHNGKITGKGIGMEVAEGLAAGWCDVADG